MTPPRIDNAELLDVRFAEVRALLDQLNDQLEELRAGGNDDDDLVRTPTATQIGKPNSYFWRQRRAWGITATDLPTILGIDPWRTADELRLSKTRGRSKYRPVPCDELHVEDPWDTVLESVPNEAAEWGLRLEDPIASAWIDRRPPGPIGSGLMIGPAGLLQHDHDTWMLCTPDRVVHGCGNADLDRPSCLLEIKTRSAAALEDWTDGVPDDVYVQVQWQLAVTGLDHAHVACLVGGQKLIEHRIDARPALHDQLRSTAHAFLDTVR